MRLAGAARVSCNRWSSSRAVQLLQQMLQQKKQELQGVRLQQG
jgi:hypothetical protein